MGTKIWQPVNLYGNYEIGEGTSIGAFSDVGGKVGKNCKIQCQVSIPPLTIIENDVFLGPGVKIMNDKHIDGNLKGIIIKKGARIGIGSIICADVGKNTIIGAGSLLLKPTGDNEVWYGNPAQKINENIDNRK